MSPVILIKYASLFQPVFRTVLLALRAESVYMRKCVAICPMFGIIPYLKGGRTGSSRRSIATYVPESTCIFTASPRDVLLYFWPV